MIFHSTRCFCFTNYLLNIPSYHVNLVDFLFVLEMIILRYMKEEEEKKLKVFIEHLLCVRPSVRRFHLCYFIFTF